MQEINQSSIKAALKTSTEIVIPAKTEKQIKGTQVILPGLKLFRMDLLTLIVEEVNTKEINGAYDFDNPTQVRKEVVGTATHAYVSALNKKNAMKKFGKRLDKIYGKPPVEAYNGNR